MLTRDNFIMVAMKGYDDPSNKTFSEFEEDVAKLSNLVRLCSKDVGPIETHLILNLVLTLFNVFEQSACVAMMFFKVKKSDWHKLKSVLLYLNRMPDYIPELKLSSSEIDECKEMTKILQQI